MQKKRFMLEFIWNNLHLHEKTTEGVYISKLAILRDYPIDKIVWDAVTKHVLAHYTPFMKRESGGFYEVDDQIGLIIFKMGKIFNRLESFEEKALFLEAVSPITLLNLNNLDELEKKLDKFLLASKIEGII